MKTFRNILWGLVFVVIGLVLGLNTLNITNINIFFDGWWTLFIIVPCFINLFEEKEKVGNLIGLLIGVALLLACQGIIDFDVIFELAIPVILVIVGLSFIFRDTINSKIRKEIKNLSKKDSEEYSAVFGGQKIDFSNEEFKGANLNAVFGGIDFDLRDSKIKDDVVITVSAVFGGIKLYLPKDIKVKVVSTPIFGGVTNDYKNSSDEKSKVVYVNATCIFGGVEIK